MNQIQSVLVKDLKEQENIRLSQKNKKENVRINKRCQFPIVTCYHKCEGISKIDIVSGSFQNTFSFSCIFPPFTFYCMFRP